MNTKKIASVLVFSYFLAFSIGFIYAKPIGVDLKDPNLNNLELGLSFPPISDGKDREFTKSLTNDLGVNHIRAAEDWSFREPEQGEFKWNPIEDRLEFCAQNQLDFFLTFKSNAPKWARDEYNERSATFKNISDFESYLKAFFEHTDKYFIPYVQFGNEWVSDWWFVGNKYQFCNYTNLFYDIVKEYSPNTQVALGGFAIGVLRELAMHYNFTDTLITEKGEIIGESDFKSQIDDKEHQKGLERTLYVLENAQYDILDIHLYDDYWNFKAYKNVIEQLAPGYPIISTEFGGPNLYWENIWNDYSSHFHAQHLQNCIETIERMNISLAYYFKPISSRSANPSHRQSGLINQMLMMKGSYHVFKAYSQGKVSFNFSYLAIYSVGLMGIISIIFTILNKIYGKMKPRKTEKNNNH